MSRNIICILLILLLSACDAASTLTEGLKQSQAVASDVEKLTGSKPDVGFNWNNGSLTSVTLHFVGIPKEKSLTELTEIARVSIKKQFKQDPKQIVIGFVVTP